MKDKLKSSFGKMKNIDVKSVEKSVRNNYKLILIVIAAVAIIIAAICTIVHFSSPSSSPRKVLTNYVTDIAETNDYSSSLEYTLRCYKNSSKKYFEENYITGFVDTNAKQSKTEGDKTTFGQFKALMYNYYELYYKLYENSIDQFYIAYFSQMAAQKSVVYGSTYMTKEFINSVYEANKKSYDDNFKKEFKEETGSDYAPTVVVSDKQKLNSSEKKAYLEMLPKDFDTILSDNNLTVDNIKSVDSFVITVSSGNQELKKSKYYVAKIKGKWYVIDSFNSDEQTKNNQ